ncbi:MAG: aromatic amino acid transport family protein, partial [Candidatus Nanoarchaeia archaeon]|nr:aromatic amino acid transport family protein [Candidatus Nanoarchaeia archaeon]
MVKFITAASVLIGTIIGAGYLGIPYVVAQSGFPLGLINLAVVCAILLLTMLYLGEISLRTKERHQLPGYAEKYLGKKGKILMFFALVIGIYSALLAYLIAEGESWSVLLFGSTAYSLHISLIFWLILSLMSYFGLKAVEEADLVGISLVAIMIISLVVLFWNRIDVSNLNHVSPKNFFVPFGVILFAFLGES